jgi:hypothetical protein
VIDGQDKGLLVEKGTPGHDARPIDGEGSLRAVWQAEITLTEMNNTRKARKIIAEARDLLGGNGILLDFHVMRHLADIEATHTYEGTETTQTLIVGLDITGASAFASGPDHPVRRHPRRPGPAAHRGPRSGRPVLLITGLCSSATSPASYIP